MPLCYNSSAWQHSHHAFPGVVDPDLTGLKLQGFHEWQFPLHCLDFFQSLPLSIHIIFSIGKREMDFPRKNILLYNRFFFYYIWNKTCWTFKLDSEEEKGTIDHIANICCLLKCSKNIFFNHCAFDVHYEHLQSKVFDCADHEKLLSKRSLCALAFDCPDEDPRPQGYVTRDQYEDHLQYGILNYDAWMW